MSTKISWCDETWNPICGCSKISAGCKNCFAEKMAIRLRGMGIEQYSHVLWPKHFEGAENKKGWNGKTVFVESALTKPLHWRKPRTIFVCSMSDLFHESVPREWIAKVFDAAYHAYIERGHRFMFLTKRAKRMCEEVSTWSIARGISMGDVEFHFGVTVENDDNLYRIDYLIETPAAQRFVSFEPLLHETHPRYTVLGAIDYAFIGPESGPGARLCTLDDIRYLMSRCKCAGIKIHVKQIPLNGKCNKKFNEWPPEFQVREV